VTEFAAQLGGGVEIQLYGSWHVACESGATIFVRDRREAENLPETSLWSASVASSVAF
jgi:hypothetical protein